MAALQPWLLQHQNERHHLIAVGDAARKWLHRHPEPSPACTCSNVPHGHLAAPRRHSQRLQVVFAAQYDLAEALEVASSPMHTSSSSGNGAEPPHDADAPWAPEAFQLGAGVLSEVDRLSESGEPASAFRCDGCTREECQVIAVAPQTCRLTTSCAGASADPWLRLAGKTCPYIHRLQCCADSVECGW